MALMTEYSKPITEYDQMLLMEDADAKKWRLSNVGHMNTSLGTDVSIYMRESVLAICRHVTEDFLGWSVEDTCTHFNARIAKMYRLERVLCYVDHDREWIPSYGFMHFFTLDDINYHYLTSLMYPGKALFLYPSGKRRFSYPKEALLYYKRVISSKDIASRGGSALNTRIPRSMLENISIDDEREMVTEFLRYFCNDFCAHDITVSGKGRAHDLYRFFSNTALVNRRVRDSGLETIFSGRAMSYYDLLCDYMPFLVKNDDDFYRKVFSYLTAAAIKPT